MKNFVSRIAKENIYQLYRTFENDERDIIGESSRMRLMKNFRILRERTIDYPQMNNYRLK